MPAPEIEALRALLDHAIKLARELPTRPATALLDMAEDAARTMRSFRRCLDDLKKREAQLSADDQAALLAVTLEAKAAAPLFEQAAKAAERAADEQG